MTVKIVTDTGCDLPAALIAQHDITLVPLILRFGDRDVPDAETSRAELWERIDAGLPCDTSGPPIGFYEEAYRPLVEAGHDIVCITLTGAHSVTYSSAWAAAQAFPGKVTVLDSRSLSLGYGMLILRAAQVAGAGGDVAAVTAVTRSVRERTFLRFFLESLDQVRRGGRLDTLMPVLGRLGAALNVRALLTVNDEGRISLVGPARGRRGAVKRMIQEAAATAPVEMVAVGHARRPEEAGAMAEELALRLAVPQAKILVAELGPVFIAHAGEGTMGVGTVTRLQGLENP
jgi:DegV family protein with EDD domain